MFLDIGKIKLGFGMTPNNGIQGVGERIPIPITTHSMKNKQNTRERHCEAHSHQFGGCVGGCAGWKLAGNG